MAKLQLRGSVQELRGTRGKFRSSSGRIYHFRTDLQREVTWRRFPKGGSEFEFGDHPPASTLRVKDEVVANFKTGKGITAIGLIPAMTEPSAKQRKQSPRYGGQALLRRKAV